MFRLGIYPSQIEVFLAALDDFLDEKIFLKIFKWKFFSEWANQTAVIL